MGFLAPLLSRKYLDLEIGTFLYIWYSMLLLLLSRGCFPSVFWSFLVLRLHFFFPPPLSGLPSGCIKIVSKSVCLWCQLAVQILKKSAEEREGSFWLMWALCLTPVLPGTAVSVKHQGDSHCCLTSAVLTGQVGKNWGRRKCTCIQFKEHNEVTVPAGLLQQ